MSKYLKMSNKKAYEKINSLLHEMSTITKIPYEIKPNTHFTTGGTVSSNTTTKPTKIFIGINGLKENKILPQQYIPDQNFIQTIVNIYHETQHYYQITQTFQSDNPTKTDVAQTLCAIACQNNPHYYLDNGNYFKNPNEIEAEYYGIMNTYEYLCDTFPNIDKNIHEQLMVNFVNQKSEQYSYWIHHSNDKQFTSLFEIEQAFDKAYDNSFEQKRTYFTLQSRDYNDEARQYIQKNLDIIDIYNNQPNGTSQDKIIASINCHLHSDLQNKYKSIQKIDLSYDNNIKIEKPKRKIPSTFEDIYQNSLQQKENSPEY